MAAQEVTDVGYLLHRRRLRETSFVLQFFTRLHGRVSLVARGLVSTRRPTPSLNEFAPYHLVWQGRGDLPSLRRHEPAGRPALLQGERVFSGLYVNELVARLLEREDAAPEVWSAYETVIDALSTVEAIEPVLRRFEVALLEACGYGLVLDLTADTDEPVRAGQRYAYVPERGPVGGAPTVAHREVSGDTLRALAGEGAWTPACLSEAKHLMRFLLQQYLGGRPLAARSLFSPGAVR
jgi:DNA repair protein RecO (recombination protein O)